DHSLTRRNRSWRGRLMLLARAPQRPRRHKLRPPHSPRLLAPPLPRRRLASRSSVTTSASRATAKPMRSLQALVLAVALLPAVASAQTSEDEKRNAARDLGQKGNAAYDQGDFATAIDLYRRASSLYPVPTLSVRLG